MRMLPFDGRLTRPHEVAKTRIQAIMTHGFIRVFTTSRRRAARRRRTVFCELCVFVA